MKEIVKKNNNTLRDLFLENGLFSDKPKQYSFFKKFLIEQYSFNKNNEKFLEELYNYYLKICDNFQYLNLIKNNKDWSKLYIIFNNYAEKTTTRYNIKYWLARGYSESEGKQIISELCSRSLENTVKKYGIEEGTKKFNERVKKSGETYSKLYKNGKIDFSNRKPRNRLNHKQSSKPKYSYSLRYLFLDENYIYTDQPKDFNYFSNFLIKEYGFSNTNIEYLKLLYDYYIKLCDNYLYLNKKIKFDGNNLTVLFPEYIKKCSIFRKEHWLYRGYTEAEATQIISDIQKNIVLTQDNAVKKYGYELGKQKYTEYISKLSNILKNGYAIGKFKYHMAYSKTINPETNEFYTEEECLEKMKENWKLASKKCTELIKAGKIKTVWEKEFWIQKGLTEAEAKQKIYDLMFHNDYEYLIQKYGEKLGKEKYEKRLKKYKETINAKSDEEKKIWNLKRTRISHKTSKAATQFFEKCIIELKNILGNDIIDIQYIKYNTNEYFLYDDENKTVYFYDYTDLKNKIIIEFNGIKFHPKYWEMSNEELQEWKSLGYHVDGITQMNKDIRKKEIAIKNNFKFDVIWEDQTFDEKMNIIKKIYNIL